MNCQVVPTKTGWRCPRCKFEDKRRKPKGPIFRECPATTDGPKQAPAPLVFNDLSRGPCVHRGKLVSIERCQIGCQKNKKIETFLCLPDVGCQGPPLIASEAQWSHAQTLNRSREVCKRCVRYVPRGIPEVS